MTKYQKLYILISFSVMAFSGVGIHILDEHFPLLTEFGKRSNPLIDELKLVHNLFNFLFIFGVGLIFNNHILLGLLGRKKDKRFSGTIIFVLINLLIISGVLLLYSGNDKLLELLELLHWIFGLGLIAFLIFHLFSTRTSKILKK